MAKYQRITTEERILIFEWMQAGKSNRQIAGILRRSVSTIGRELKRHGGKAGYCPQQAQSHAKELSWRAGRGHSGSLPK
ncbi:MAG: helix-turn-helix domain-containing protein [Puniceicoccales bacterium]|jgi:IS30 family transposase|nr:helix-turn-helix domain-containing protein [Puniceicoccales bacterium]